MNEIVFLDCTLRDGGYYNSWDFEHDLVQSYLYAIKDAGVNFVEIGFRTLDKNGFKGAFAYSNDTYIDLFEIPQGLNVAVMINASEILIDGLCDKEKINQLFPLDSQKSNISLVRIASHPHEVIEALKACESLKSKGFKIGFNLMQVSECDSNQITSIVKEVSKYPIEVLYFADSLGNMTTEKILDVIKLMRLHWEGALGFHAHDNMSLGLANTLYAMKNGITWVDSTVTGMGRGAGNVKTEHLAIEISELRNNELNIKPIISLISKYFKSLKSEYEWGTNPFYYLSGKYSIHPTYVQEMLVDTRYQEEDIISVIDNLKNSNGNKYSKNSLTDARNYYRKDSIGNWSPIELFKNKEVLLIGSGPGVSLHKKVLEEYISKRKPLVIALNAQSSIENDLIDVRIACHPLRLKTDYLKLLEFSKPLIMPISGLSGDFSNFIHSFEILDYGLSVNENEFKIEDRHCILPSPLVLGYAIAAVSSGKAKRLLLAGFDGYKADDPLKLENELIFKKYQEINLITPLLAITPTLYNIKSTSIYAL